MQFERNNTEFTLTLPRNYCGYLTPKLRSDEIHTIIGNQQSKGEVNLKQETAKNTKKTSSKIPKKDTIWQFPKQI